MPLKAYLSSKFDTTAEREFFDILIDKLDKKYSNTDEQVILIGNLSCSGKEIDAVLFKNSAIIILEFKNYGGNIIFSENGDWKSDNTIIKGGSNGKNPLKQVKDNKFALISTLNSLLPDNKNNLSHLAGVVVFHQSIDFDIDSIKYPIRSWFHITDKNNFVRKIEQITSNEINISNSDLNLIPELFNIKNKIYFETENDYNEKIEEIINKNDYIKVNPPKRKDLKKTKMKVFGVGDTINHALKYNLYHRKVRNGDSYFEYVGLYNNKSIKYIGKVENVIFAEINNNILNVIQSQFEPTEKQLENIEKAIKSRTDADISKGHKFFCVEKFEPTDFRKITSGGLQGQKIFILENYLEKDDLESTVKITNKLRYVIWE